MSLRLVHLLPHHTALNQNPSRKPESHNPTIRPVPRIWCIRNYDDDNSRKMKMKKKKKKMNDSELAKDLAREVAKVNAISDQKREAMKKSREILWGELCRHMCLREDEMRNKWRRIGEDEKWVLVRGFVEEWSGDFQPLSVRSVKEMVEEECLDGEKMKDSESAALSSSSFSGLFPGLKRIIGFE